LKESALNEVCVEERVCRIPDVIAAALNPWPDFALAGQPGRLSLRERIKLPGSRA
jgi:hypothetical protein